MGQVELTDVLPDGLTFLKIFRDQHYLGNVSGMGTDGRCGRYGYSVFTVVGNPLLKTPEYPDGIISNDDNFYLVRPEYNTTNSSLDGLFPNRPSSVNRPYMEVKDLNFPAVAAML